MYRPVVSSIPHPLSFTDTITVHPSFFRVIAIFPPGSVNFMAFEIKLLHTISSNDSSQVIITSSILVSNSIFRSSQAPSKDKRTCRSCSPTFKECLARVGQQLPGHIAPAVSQLGYFFLCDISYFLFIKKGLFIETVYQQRIDHPRVRDTKGNCA